MLGPNYAGLFIDTKLMDEGFDSLSQLFLFDRFDFTSVNNN